jgi:cell division protein FtsA
MQAKNTIAGLDIGSHKMCCALGAIGPEGDLVLSAVAEVPSEGVKNGLIVNMEKASNRVAEVMKRIEDDCGMKPGPLYVSVTGDHIRGLNSRGAISVSMIENEITEEEIERVIELAKNVRIPEDQERLHVMPQHYAVDDRDGIRDPVGMSGERLEVEVHIITASMKAAGSLLECVKQAGGDVSEMVFSPIAASEVLLTPDEKRRGSVILDIGSGTVDIALHYQDTVWFSASIPLGGRNVTSDIAYGLRLPMDSAEELKICQGSAIISRVDPTEKLTLPDLGEFYQRRISRTVLAAIIEPRMEEIFRLIKKQLVNSPVFDSIECGIVLTGGGACLKDAEYLAQRIFGHNARLATPRVDDGESYFTNPYGAAVALGLVKYGFLQRSPQSERPGVFGRMARGLEKVVSAILNI